MSGSEKVHKGELALRPQVTWNQRVQCPGFLPFAHCTGHPVRVEHRQHSGGGVGTTEQLSEGTRDVQDTLDMSREPSSWNKTPFTDSAHTM